MCVYFLSVVYMDFSNVTIQIYVALVMEAGEGDGTPLQYSCLENPMDRGAW